MKNIIDRIYDELDSSPITLYNELGKPITFEQICLVPLKGKDYVILKPITKIDGVGEDEGIVFEIVDDNLILVQDFDIIDPVFDVYFSLLENNKVGD